MRAGRVFGCAIEGGGIGGKMAAAPSTLTLLNVTLKILPTLSNRSERRDVQR